VPLIARLGRAAGDVLSRPALWWALAAVFWLRVAIFSAVTPRRPDAELMWRGARAYLTDPAHMYDAAAGYLARLHIIAPPGGLDSFIGPPTLAALAIPLAPLPMNVAIQLWALMDAAAMLVALAVLYRVVAGRHRLARPLFWLVAGYFPPLFADLSAGQRGGVLLLGATASIWLEASRPVLAGAAVGVAAALKYYPAAMVIGVSPKHRLRYAAALSAALVLVTAASFIPLGLNGAISYYQHVLLPSLASYNPDCAYDSVRTLFMRTIGGEQYAQPADAGYVLVTSPVHLPQVALALSYLSALIFTGAAAWAAWRSGWNPAYGMSVGFALGALIPNEVWPYQWLALLPLVLLLVVRGIERRKVGMLVLLSVFLLGFYRQPCDLVFPNVWTLAGIGIFVLGVWENRLFRAGSSREGGYGAQ
jgi:hypothetical protein